MHISIMLSLFILVIIADLNIEKLKIEKEKIKKINQTTIRFIIPIIIGIGIVYISNTISIANNLTQLEKQTQSLYKIQKMPLKKQEHTKYIKLFNEYKNKYNKRLFINKYKCNNTYYWLIGFNIIRSCGTIENLKYMNK